MLNLPSCNIYSMPYSEYGALISRRPETMNKYMALHGPSPTGLDVTQTDLKASNEPILQYFRPVYFITSHL